MFVMKPEEVEHLPAARLATMQILSLITDPKRMTHTKFVSQQVATLSITLEN
jgi:hypothetical protein